MPIRLQGRLGESYAGVWFDNKKGEFVVPLLADASRAAIDNQFTAADLEGEDFRVVPARSSWEELEAAQERINTSLQPLIDGSLVQTALDPRTNAVVIYEAGKLGSEGRAHIHALSAQEDVAVEVRESGAEAFRVEPATCVATYPRRCGNPLRGGVALTRDASSYEDGECTTVFKAIGNVYGNRFILTAGHCAAAYPHWQSPDTNWEEIPIGSVEEYSFPAAIGPKIKANGSEWDTTPSWPSEVAWWGVPGLLDRK